MLRDYYLMIAKTYSLSGCTDLYTHPKLTASRLYWDDHPPPLPRCLVFQPVSTNSTVSWKPPDPWMINGINQGYKLQAWKTHPQNSSEPYETLTVPPSPLPHALESAILLGLDKFTNYYITVLCFTNPGDGNRS
ncbi:unnamed protein product, partial [Meganyctiphanes norvegica]